MKKLSSVVIDPQVGFCKPSGSLAKVHGVCELAKISEVIPSIKLALERSHRRHLVLAEYSRGQFTEGVLSNPLSNLCVPFENNDCQLIDELTGVDFHSSTIKNEQSALSQSSFVADIEKDLSKGVELFVVSGFLFDHCVKITALELNELVSPCGARVCVASDLSASRKSKYENGLVAETVGSLIKSGVIYGASKNILP